MQKVELPDDQVGGVVVRKTARAMPSEHAIVGEIGHIEMTGAVNRDLRGTGNRASVAEVVGVKDRFAENRSRGWTGRRGSNRRHRSCAGDQHNEPHETDTPPTTNLSERHECSPGLVRNSPFSPTG